MLDKKDLELISSSAKAMARHFKAFTLAEEIVDKVINSENRLRELESETAEAEDKLKAIQAEVAKKDALLKQSEEKSRNAIQEADIQTAARVKEIEAQVKTAKEISDQKMEELRLAGDNSRKEIECLIEAKKAELTKLTNEHSDLMVKYAKEESEAIRKVEMAKAEMEKARNMLK